MHNIVSLIGFFIEKAVMVSTPLGHVRATFPLMTIGEYPKPLTTGTVPEIHRIVMWGSIAEYVQRCIPYQLMYVQGRLATRCWRDKDHILHTMVDIIASDFRLLQILSTEDVENLPEPLDTPYYFNPELAFYIPPEEPDHLAMVEMYGIEGYRQLLAERSYAD